MRRIKERCERKSGFRGRSDVDGIRRTRELFVRVYS